MAASSATLEPQEKYYFVYSHNVDSFVQVKIGTLQGQRQEKSHKELVDDPILRYSGAYEGGYSSLYITVQVFADGRPLALPTRTSFKAFSTRWSWNEWLTLPIKYSDLPPTALLAVTIWDVCGSRRTIPVGSTTVALFGKYKALRNGKEDLRVWPDVAATPQTISQLPGLIKDPSDRMAQLTKLVKQHRKGQMPHADWLDRLAFREIEQIMEEEKRISNFMFLQVEFPTFACPGLNVDYDIVYYEKGGDSVERVRTKAEVVRVVDPDISADNLVENKHHKLTHSLRHGPVVKDLKPNKTTRDHLQKIINMPPAESVNAEDQALFWKFRYYLTSDKKALPKFLRYIDWSNKQEADQALELLEQWVPMDIDASLELLSKSFKNKTVRRYAVSRLQHVSDEDLLLYLLQLVQALRYEEPSADYLTLQVSASHFGDPDDQASNDHLPDLDAQGGMTDPLGGIRVTDPLGGIPISAKDNTNATSGVASSLSDTLIMDPLGVNPMMKRDSSGEMVTADAAANNMPLEKLPSLASFLVARASQNSSLASFFYWYLTVECEDCIQQEVKANPFAPVLRHFQMVMSQGNYELMERWTHIRRQIKFIGRLAGIVKQVAAGKEARPKKIEKLQSMLNTPQFTDFEPFPLPLDPTIMVKGIVPHKSHLFKSALMPTRIHFVTTTNDEYVALFKNGDDLRQDQLILQMITLMDKVLRQENLDLKLSPYQCLATGTSQGFVQFLDSIPVAQVLATDGSIQTFFKRAAPCDESKNGIQPDVMDTYVRSCAGYCVITYLLGIGDRHLDNLLLTTSGHLFHVDFGFILGRDPKPFPPPMKLSKEMVEAMGGNSSPDYQKFRQHCYNAFLLLRRSATGLILNLFELMVDANIEDIALEPDKTVSKVQEKFCLDMSEEQAVKFFQQLIDESVSAISAVMVEQIHKWAQYWRR